MDNATAIRALLLKLKRMKAIDHTIRPRDYLAKGGKRRKKSKTKRKK